MDIYNTLTRKKEKFVPQAPNTVKMYTCGQTTYNDIHVGNARFYVVFDVIRRYLEYKGYTVEFVQNFTDVDDKIIARANEEGVSINDIAERYIASTLKDLDDLNVKRATINPRVSAEMAEILNLVQELVAGGFAYAVDGTVYFKIDKFQDYGKLSGKKLDELEAGARVEIEKGKENPSDFVLWKPAKPGEPSWESPWGKGRPGWHIECSAMARKYLGETIDIHGGGADLIFPHHENEIAQTEAVTGKNFANYWMHCGVLTVDHKKMSKSRGNFATFADISSKFPHDVIRFYFLNGHYRMPLEFTDAVVNGSAQGLQRIKNCYSNITHALSQTNSNHTSLPQQEYSASPYCDAFFKAMDDDFNTADAISAIFELVRYTNQALSTDTKPDENFLRATQKQLAHLMDILGIDISPKADTVDVQKIDALIEARQNARKQKDFAESDRIRDTLLEMGITLEDTREGVRWYKS